MNRMEFIGAIAEKLRKDNARKPISIPKHVFHISDDEGNSKDFIVRKTDRNYVYNKDDVRNVIDAAMEIILETLRAGDSVSISGFGSLGLVYRLQRSTKDPNGNPIVIPGHFVPKFTFGKSMRRAAKLYEVDLAEREELPKENKG